MGSVITRRGINGPSTWTWSPLSRPTHPPTPHTPLHRHLLGSLAGFFTSHLQTTAQFVPILPPLAVRRMIILFMCNGSYSVAAAAMTPPDQRHESMQMESHQQEADLWSCPDIEQGRKAVELVWWMSPAGECRPSCYCPLHYPRLGDPH